MREPPAKPEWPPSRPVSEVTAIPTELPAGAVLPSGAGRVVETVLTVLTGLILAFIFRAFFVEPFIIPTGSMAPTLYGAHATRTCPACGWMYDFAPRRTARAAGERFVVPSEIICPNCQLRLQPTPEETYPKAGDRILVHKWAYALGNLLPPRRWDVVVFRDPADPEQHYIKRVVGLPNESVEIIDGDVFIDGHIARKPAHVQDALWFVVFDQSYSPHPDAASARFPRWRTFEPARPGAGWQGLSTRVIRYAGLDNQPRRLNFNPDAGREYLLDLYAYNRGDDGNFVNDLRLQTEITPQDGEGSVRLELNRQPCSFAAELDADGRVRLSMRLHLTTGQHRNMLVAERRIAPWRFGQPIAIEFGHVDYRAYLRIDQRLVVQTDPNTYGLCVQQNGDRRTTMLTVPGGELPAVDTQTQELSPASTEELALRSLPRREPVGLAIVATNLRLQMRHTRVQRDVYYVSRSERVRRASPGQPFQLHGAEYFVLGDNSPDSHDSREWARGGIHMSEGYRPGTVPADQIVGQAAFVYLPSLLPRGRQGGWRVPDMGRVRFVR